MSTPRVATPYRTKLFITMVSFTSRLLNVLVESVELEMVMSLRTGGVELRPLRSFPRFSVAFLSRLPDLHARGVV